MLSKRLLALCDLVEPGTKVADIGCDHGLLSIHLMQTGKAAGVVACDINEGPLQVAERNIKRFGCKGIELRLGDGLSRIEPGEVQTVIIAGMGGELIAQIIEAAPFLQSREYTLLLQPMSRAYELRRYLAQHGFSIVRELAVRDKRLYTVLQVGYTGKPCVPDSAFCAFGALQPEEPDAAAYIARIKRNAAACLQQIERCGGTEEKARILKEILEHEWR
ncbi:MAG: SAM-dependent methyltransferase [Clostridia bacterium]|nr:SAM-dependent methyltransferase [Clostridia bacterium]